MRHVRYWLARFHWWIRTPEPKCTLRRCPAPRVWLSAWCRTHSNQIINGSHDPELAEALNGLGFPPQEDQ